MFGGQMTSGGSVSLTVTVNPQVEPPSDTQLTAVSPVGKKTPDGGRQVTWPQEPMMSSGGKVIIAPHLLGSVDLVMGAGHVMLQGNPITGKHDENSEVLL